jgi:RNA polymerase sigma factor (sigma-70 family)
VRKRYTDDDVPLAEALAGDAAAWDHIIEQHSRLLWWIARSYRLDDSTAQDVAQTVWFQLKDRGRSIRDPKKLRGWLSTTARREALRQASRRDIPTEDLGYAEADRYTGSVDEAVIDEELTGMVLAAFAQLPAKDQELLRLVTDVPPKSYTEIAELLGKSHGYIGPSRQRAVARLRQILNDMGGLV